jgi:Mg2+ and Co2+ transporter CorA|tara:strand:+ start:3163 stop:3348 length:186 start_codon:yes stop_codon:yes gene_type:complete
MDDYVALAESLGYEVDEVSKEILLAQHSKSQALKYMRRLPKKVAKPKKAAPKKAAKKESEE